MSLPAMLPEWNWTVGEVVAPFGIRGEMKVRLESDFPDRFARLLTVCLRPRKGEPKLFTVKSSRIHKGQVLLKLEGVERIEDVDAWRGAWVQVQKDQAVALPQDNYYVHELVGLEVVTKDGRALGKLDRVLPNPGHDLWQVGEALIPAVKQIVVSVDTAARRITIDPPAGMLPGDEPETAE